MVDDGRVDGQHIRLFRDHTFAEQKAGRKLAIRSRRPHDHREGLASDSDLERPLDGHRVGRRLAPAGSDTDDVDAMNAGTMGHGRQDNIWPAMSFFGLGQQKPHHYREMVRIVWENRDQLPFAWRILNNGVCDGCALGTSGLKDWTLPGTHLCMVRLELLRLNTAPALDPAVLADVAALRTRTSAGLRALGRLPEPLLRRHGERGFRVVSWDEALRVAADGVRATAPERLAFYLTSRGITNEVYYAAQKAARFFGTNHVDNSARLCHAASTVAMKATLGHGAATCSYSDWLDADLIVLFGSNVANNQPVTTKYLHHAKARGAAVAVVNPYREPGLARYWVPSIAKSAISGTALADHWFDVHTGGDLAFLVGALKALVEHGGLDQGFIDAHTSGFDQVRAQADEATWDDIERESGVAREAIEAFAGLLVDRPKAIFVWSMGLTQHAHGVDTVRALVNLGLARGLPLRAGSGLVPIRGHSGVQGGAEVGCVPTVSTETAGRWAAAWGFTPPSARGWTATEMIAASAQGGVDTFWIVGGNFLETLPDTAEAARALARPRLRIHQDIVLSSSMLVDGAGDVLILPATTRYESPGGGTETSTERRIIFSPEITGRRVGSAQAEWWVLREVMARVDPRRAHLVGLEDAAAIRGEIERTQPLYAGVGGLAVKGDQVQWGGRRLYADGRFATPDGRAHFAPATLRSRPLPAHAFFVSTRRGKQFNSMVQRDVDPLTGAARDDVLISESDLARLGGTAGSRVALYSATGVFDGRLRPAPIRDGNLEVHWPEGNVLLAGAPHDPESLEPDYNAIVTVELRPASRDQRP
jgi:molybdopterin-dependent oxidoreductase alpha subunit